MENEPFLTGDEIKEEFKKDILKIDDIFKKNKLTVPEYETIMEITKEVYQKLIEASICGRANLRIIAECGIPFYSKFISYEAQTECEYPSINAYHYNDEDDVS